MAKGEFANRLLTRTRQRASFVRFLVRHNRPQYLIELFHRFFLDTRQYMAVGIKCNTDIRMPQSLTYDLRVHALLK